MNFDGSNFEPLRPPSSISFPSGAVSSTVAPPCTRFSLPSSALCLLFTETAPASVLPGILFPDDAFKVRFAGPTSKFLAPLLMVLLNILAADLAPARLRPVPFPPRPRLSKRLFIIGCDCWRNCWLAIAEYLPSEYFWAYEKDNLKVNITTLLIVFSLRHVDLHSSVCR